MWWVTILYLTFALIAPFQKVHTDINKTPKKKKAKTLHLIQCVKINPKPKILHRKVKNIYFEGQSQKKYFFFFKKHWGLLVNQADEIQHVRLHRQKLGVYISSGNISLCLAGKEFGNKSSSFLRLARPTRLHRKFFKSGNEDPFCMGQEILTLGYYFLKCETTTFTSALSKSIIIHSVFVKSSWVFLLLFIFI